MRRVALALFSTVTGLVMLLSFKTHSPAAVSAPVPVATSGPDTASGSGSSPAGTATAPSSAAPSSAAPAPASSTSTTRTISGDAADTRFGPVQVQITVTNGTITAVNATEYPQNDPRDQQINAYAIPQLNQEALAAKSASIDMVSGATYTSDGYLSSLQSALDKAGL
jgi:uncharacterized protein with FMN-binding domain